jgi:hypothetical protein
MLDLSVARGQRLRSYTQKNAKMADVKPLWVGAGRVCMSAPRFSFSIVLVMQMAVAMLLRG